MSHRVAVVLAHPDDDTYGFAGSAALLAARHPDFALAVILATSGEAGVISDPALAARESLGEVREAEDRASWSTLGVVPEEHRFLRYPDGGLADAPREELVGRIEELLTAFRPDVVVTFGPEGITGHDDHIAIGEATVDAFSRARRGAGEGFARLLRFCIARTEFDEFAELLRERGFEPPDPTQPFQPRPTPDEEIAVRMDCRETVDRKLAALREHATQAGEIEAIPEDVWAPVLRFETFTQDWPERPPGAPVLGDVFEGLEG